MDPKDIAPQIGEAQQRALESVRAKVLGASQSRELRLRPDSLDDSIDVDKRTLHLSFASESARVERWYGIEILDCSPSSVRLGRLNDGASMLFNHGRDELIGVVEEARADPDRVCRSLTRFDTGADGEKRWQQVLNRVLTKVSVGYFVHEMRFESETDGVTTYRITDWEPFEISMVTVPADAGVGAGRDLDLPGNSALAAPTTKSNTTPPQLTRKESKMDEDNKPTPGPTPDQKQLAERTADIQRRDAIIALARQHDAYLNVTDVQDACTKGSTVEAVQQLVIQRMATKHSDTRGVHIGLSDKEVGDYSIAKAVRGMLTGDWKEAGLERAASDAVEKRFGTSTKGLWLPYDVPARRDFTVGTANQAGNLVATDLRADMFADILRKRLVLGRMGAMFLFGLTSNVDIPKKLTGSSLTTYAEVAASAEVSVTTGKVSMAPKRIGGHISFSKQAVIQSTLAIEPMLRKDILDEYAVQVEDYGLNGNGVGTNPRGLRATSGIGAVIGGANGAALTWDHLVDLESACANVNNEPDERSGYVVNTAIRGRTKKTLKAAGVHDFIWDNGTTPLNGYRAGVTNLAPNNLTKGTSVGNCSSVIFGSDWSDLLIGMFGAIELLVDEVTLARDGENQLIMNAFMDTAVRRASSFAVMDDALA